MGRVLPFFKVGGVCPECGRRSGMVPIRHLLIGFCDAHRTQWLTGFKTAIQAPGDTSSDWAINQANLEGYQHTGPTSATLETRREAS